MKQSSASHFDLLCDIGELADLLVDAADIDGFLQQTVQMVADHLRADVGSIYIYDKNSDELVLAATRGLNPESVGKIRMHPGEGLVGQTMAKLQPLCEGCVGRNPAFKYFELAHEDPFNSFLGVPIYRGHERIGVLVVQHERTDFFHESDQMVLRAIASQLAGVIANARSIMDMSRGREVPMANGLMERLQFIKGESAVAGFAHAPVVVMGGSRPSMFYENEPADHFHCSLEKFQGAVKRTIEQITELQQRMADLLPEATALIFDAHLMVLKDPRFAPAMARHIKEGAAAPVAVRNVARLYVKRFDESGDPYIQEKAADIQDLARRLLDNLRRHDPEHPDPVTSRIVVARQMFPSDVLKLASESVAGIVLVSGAVTSHVAIIARSLKIPVIIAPRRELLQLSNGTPLLMDADMGTLYVNPSPRVIQQFSMRDSTRRQAAQSAPHMDDETHTRDGIRITLLANINLIGELALARQLKAEGIGLYRSEFPFLVRPVFPSEMEQILVYRHLFEKMPGRPVNLRTLDIGGDKLLPYLDSPLGDNPELGLRSIRFSLRHRDIFDQQLRAILRAAAGADQVGILFPMISSLEDFLQARQAVHEVRAVLEKEGLEHHSEPLLGAMIELPAVAEVIDDLAEVADFFSIGTNDFVQYMLAVDRTNEAVAVYYQPYHPAVLRSLARIVKSVEKRQKRIAVCGEVAHDLQYVSFLLGIGIRRFSVDPQFLAPLQQHIRTISVAQCQDYTQRLLAATTVAQVLDIAANF
jgi:phosphotransferase system enzyme I (PtsP)